MLLSIVTCGKNDEYAGNFIQRMQLNLSKLESNIKKLNTNEIEVIVLDWGSEQKLYDVLDVKDFNHTKFYHVNKDLATKLSPDSNFFYTKSMNAAYRRSSGSFIFFIDGDSYVPFHSLKNLFELVKNTNNPYTFYWASRYHLPYELHSSTSDTSKIDEYIEDWCINKDGWRHEKISLTNFFGAAMGLLLSRNICEESTCWIESMNKWGWVDIELNHRISRRYPCNGDLEDYLDSYFFHLDHHSLKFGGNNLQIGGNPQIISSKFDANEESWGLINEELTSN